MADLLYDIAVSVYDELGALKGGTATGGSTTTVVDTSLGGSDDNYNGGIVMVVHSTDSAAPESEFAKVTDYGESSGTGTITLAPALSVACASGDEYAVSNNDYPFEDVRRIINRTLRWLGPFPAVDETLTIASGTLEYTIPIAAKEDLRQVWVDLGNEQWSELFNWRVEPHGTAGSTSTLIFRSQPESGSLLLLYLTKHSRLWLDTDKILEYLPMERIVPEVALRLLRWKLGQQKGEDPMFIAHMNYLEREVLIARSRHPVKQPQPPHKSLYSTPIGQRGNKYGPWLVP